MEPVGCCNSGSPSPKRPPASLQAPVTFQRLAGDSATFTCRRGDAGRTGRGQNRAPLRGEWVAVNGPSNASPRRHRRTAWAGWHRRDRPTVAIDFLRSTRRPPCVRCDSTDNASYYAYGKEIYSVATASSSRRRTAAPGIAAEHGGAAVPSNLVRSRQSHRRRHGKGHYAFYANVQRVRWGELGDRVKRDRSSRCREFGTRRAPFAFPRRRQRVSTRLRGYSVLDVLAGSARRCELGAAGVRCTRTSPITLKDAMRCR